MLGTRRVLSMSGAIAVSRFVSCFSSAIGRLINGSSVFDARKLSFMKKRNSRAPVVRDQDTSEQNRLGLERLIFFSDAVFAIAITVLVLDIHLPPAGTTADNSQLLLILTRLWPKYLAYIISFGVIG